MNHDKANAALEMVYSASSPEELSKSYAEWAATYDAETASLGYLLPFLITAWVARYVPKGEGPLLDVGCGTGLSGPSLKALGYEDLAGLDLSAEMLTVARSRGAYAELKDAVLGQTLPWPDRHFRAFFSTGVFTMGHAPASGLYDLVRITRKGGHAIFTVRDQVLESGGFRKVFDDLERQGKWRPLEEGPWFRCYAIADPDALVKTFVYEVL
jgi:predicted TPR repeat methyltransferase